MDDIFTYDMLSYIHGISVEQIQEAYIAERERFTEGVDTWLMDDGTRVFTPQGFIKVAKILDTPAAWEIWRRFTEGSMEGGYSAWPFEQD